MPSGFFDDPRLLAPLATRKTDLGGGAFVLQSPEALAPYARCVGEWLEHAALLRLPEAFRVAVISGDGGHFCAVLDLSEIAERSVAEGLQHSRAWHACFDAIQFGSVPVVAVLHGAVVGGGLELASSAHLRVTEISAFHALPEGKARPRASSTTSSPTATAWRGPSHWLARSPAIRRFPTTPSRKPCPESPNCRPARAFSWRP